MKKVTERRTFASVTDVPCTCGYLERAADDPRNPIVFDKQIGEYHFKHKAGLLVIYHCPFCGGAAPESKRELLFALIPPEEENRLMSLLAPVNSIATAVGAFGKPSIDEPAVTRQPERDGQPPSVEHHRHLVYDNLSEIADVWITERPDGTVAYRLQGKYVGQPKPGANT